MSWFSTGTKLRTARGQVTRAGHVDCGLTGPALGKDWPNRTLVKREAGRGRADPGSMNILMSESRREGGFCFHITQPAASARQASGPKRAALVSVLFWYTLLSTTSFPCGRE
jgi:hypothetical protein